MVAVVKQYDCMKTVFILVISALAFLNATRYEPNWDSLDTRPLPSWYDSSKVGIFIHWGVFSVPSFRSEWFWYDWQGLKANDCVAFMKDNYRPGFTYADFAPKFTAEFYNPDEWANIFKASGAEYVVLTSKHHEGYTNWPSKYSFNWNSMDVGSGRDLVGDLADSIRNNTSLRFGLYHSLYEWFNPLYLKDKANKFQTQYFVKDKTLPELYEIVNKYKPEVIWSDGDWEATDKYWNSTDFIAWLYNDSPVKDTVVTNDRWGAGVMCKHGDFLTCSDRFNPGKLQKKKWENCMTIDKDSWGYRRNAKIQDYLTIDEIITTLVETVSCGGNILINVGPTHDGIIAPVFEERLRQLGSWLQVNGEAIYKTHPWTYQNDTVTPGVWYTEKTVNNIRSVYAIVLNWPKTNQLFLKVPNIDDTSGSVQMLGYNQPIKFSQQSQGVTIHVPLFSYDTVPCKWAWVFKMLGVKN